MQREARARLLGSHATSLDSDHDPLLVALYTLAAVSELVGIALTALEIRSARVLWTEVINAPATPETGRRMAWHVPECAIRALRRRSYSSTPERCTIRGWRRSLDCGQPGLDVEVLTVPGGGRMQGLQSPIALVFTVAMGDHGGAASSGSILL